MIVTEICIYPIKSCQGISLSEAEVTPRGFLGDREFMLVNQGYRFITQRQYPQLATIKVELRANQMTLSQPQGEMTPLVIEPTWQGSQVPVEIWGDQTFAIDQGDEVAKWFHQALKLNSDKSCRLVRQSPSHQRPVEKRYAVQDSDQVSFADTYPFLLTATASLDELNRRIIEFPGSNSTIGMERFRPNLVIATQEPFVEGNWRFIQIGTIKFALVKPCSRCIVTTVDQTKGVKNEFKEPLRTLSTFRQFGTEGVMFGENMVPRSRGILKVGDRLKVLGWKEKVETSY